MMVSTYNKYSNTMNNDTNDKHTTNVAHNYISQWLAKANTNDDNNLL